jgi:arylsulfatase A-like enzyme
VPRLELSPERPRLSTMLSAAGYRTLSLSANHLICPELGMVEGFNRAAWAGWWEPYLRLGGVLQPPNATAESGGDAAPALIGRSGPAWRVIKRSSRLAYRYPFLLDSLGRVSTRLRTGNGVHAVPVSPWLEPTLDRWLTFTPRDTPVFAFVNLLETHEPYYPDAELAPSVLDWWRYARTRQDHVGWLAGRWSPTGAEFAQLHELYLRSFRAADQRLARIAEVLRRHDRWDRTMVVITSDHGQAFGEQGLLFHMLRLPEALVRVPMIVRRPDGGPGGQAAKGWASLVDVAPTLLAAAGEPGALVTSGTPLENLLDAARPDPVFSAADGLVWRTIVPEHERGNFSERRRAEFDRVMACAYQDDLKVVYDMGVAAPSTHAFALRSDPGEQHDLWPSAPEPADDLASEAQIVARRMLSGEEAASSPDVEERLRSWGYL